MGYPERGDDIIVSYLIKRRFQTSLKLTPGRFMFLPEGDVGLNNNKEHFQKMECDSKISKYWLDRLKVNK